MSAARRDCLGATNCTVSTREFQARCFKDVDGGAVVMVTALCGPGPPGMRGTFRRPAHTRHTHGTRRANNLRYEFELAGAARSGVVRVGALGYHVLHCNGARVSQTKLEPGRASEKHVFYSTFDLQPYVAVADTPC